MSSCIDDVAAWMKSNRLQLNTAKTEVLWCTSSRRQQQLPSTPLRVGQDQVTPVKAVRDLGIHLDCDLSMRTHVSKTVSSCFAALRQIRSIRRTSTRPVLKSLVVALVLSRLDYVVQLWRDYQQHCSTDCSPCSIPLLASFLESAQVRPRDATATRSPLAPCSRTH